MDQTRKRRWNIRFKSDYLRAKLKRNLEIEIQMGPNEKFWDQILKTVKDKKIKLDLPRSSIIKKSYLKIFPHNPSLNSYLLLQILVIIGFFNSPNSS
jgi:hypothetical protein